MPDAATLLSLIQVKQQHAYKKRTNVGIKFEALRQQK